MTDVPFRALGAPRPVPTEVFEPTIHNGIQNPSSMTVLNEIGQVDPSLPRVYLMRSNDPQEAYAIFQEKVPIRIDHHAPNWGEVVFAVVYKRVGDNIFQAPSRENAEWVAIKRLNRAAVQQYLAKGGEENPYKEICRMVELGDDEHVLSLRDALQDETTLFIVTKKGERTLVDIIPFASSEPMDSSQAHKIFEHILNILNYLAQHGISHRDFSPDNFLFLPGGKLVVFDLALSHRVPVDENGMRTLALPIGNFGTHAYMCPEVYLNRPFCGLYSDLWSAAVVLYNMLTNEILYYHPMPNDISFRYNILAGGLSSVPINERTVEVLQEVAQMEHGDRIHHELFRRAMAHLNMSTEAAQLLEKLLAVAPTDRWSLGQAMDSPYVRDNP